jgi:acetyl-CoA synthetase
MLMQKKKKKTKVKKRTSKKKVVRKKVKKRTSKKKVVRKKVKKRSKKKTDKLDTPNELIIKSKPEWIRASLANKAQYQKKYNESIKK